uniref:Uncharacterized protein n=1 Tax=Cannabis sativa TaxID=3483 RepID=A0A803QNB1_CANSA
MRPFLVGRPIEFYQVWTILAWSVLDEELNVKVPIPTFVAHTYESKKNKLKANRNKAPIEVHIRIREVVKEPGRLVVKPGSRKGKVIVEEIHDS